MAKPALRSSKPTAGEPPVSVGHHGFLAALRAVRPDRRGGGPDHLVGGPRFESAPVQMIHRVSLFVGLVTGILALLMVPVVLRVRPTRPPQSALNLTYAAAVGGDADGGRI